MVLRPDLNTFNELLDLAREGASFDGMNYFSSTVGLELTQLCEGADQGLLNIHFKDWHRLSFNYNATPSSSYQ